MIAGALVAIIFPLYLTILIAVKSPQDMVPSALSFPKSLRFENFTEAIEMTNFFDALKKQFNNNNFGINSYNTFKFFSFICHS